MSHLSYLAIGTMSGTSCDGVDAAAVETDGTHNLILHPQWCTYSKYTNEERQVLLKAMHEPDTYFEEAEHIVTQRHIACLQKLLEKMPAKSEPIIGLHGQTLIHKPHEKQSLQIGNAQKIADCLSLPVVSDFRSRDIELGGQGAPLAPIGHLLLTRMVLHKIQSTPIAVLNIGGVSNITLIPPSLEENELIACDVGPGNALLDDYVYTFIQKPFDKGGEIAQRGKACPQALAQLQKHHYFSQPAPKSLDRNAFALLARSVFHGMPLENILATLVAFTVWSLKHFLDHISPHLQPKVIVVGGGGGHNTFLLNSLKKAIEPIELIPAHDLGWCTNFLEAQIFGILAVRSTLGLPLSFPNTTGISHPSTGGKIFKSEKTPSFL